ncbi:MAG: hypothetical protein A2600_13800 [Candidatus Lambdaproteobacteria bacterium RIFOXYD1_FULL_56_27]|uniref:Uncharacterized protein n=1 Tax=Candidatus Lambdaproteobacteria bacterium RIFOXYD2_FULL_56_26 TaxID=1817773 RepID=A0A1F6GLJ0_9PROT|nr:MAG: hypothetical protein A2557_00560 [Candidatus Lambdaproteobacteria bacterium RIFOXYD2_FULL_56_26]OGH01564.1 MAG: hypothetical protein A2426_11360 [Candidatus Lambdaproteobacteria bacterium RIFOXYC1_FULL_56_13]OGH08828.1 MAG: hypothetical protein A2600_13800 [Candidatus Lambdaproteobacteria bacterium RIFOXYD1_FULL_56_27]
MRQSKVKELNALAVRVCMVAIANGKVPNVKGTRRKLKEAYKAHQGPPDQFVQLVEAGIKVAMEKTQGKKEAK